MQITKEQFEALVRADAQREFPLVNHEGPIDFSINDRQRDHRGTYIAARMEHEWPLVAVIRQAYEAIDSLNDSGFGPLTSIEGVQAMSACIDALSTYTTKPTDQ